VGNWLEMTQVWLKYKENLYGVMKDLPQNMEDINQGKFIWGNEGSSSVYGGHEETTQFHYGLLPWVSNNRLWNGTAQTLSVS